MWKAGLLRPGDEGYTMTARNNSPAPSIRSMGSTTSRLTNGRRSKLEQILSQEQQKPKRQLQPTQRRRRRPPRVSSSNDLRKVAAHRSHQQKNNPRRHPKNLRQQSRSVEPRRNRNRRNLYAKEDDGDDDEAAWGDGRNTASMVAGHDENSAAENPDTSRRGVTVVLPEAIFFNGMNCIERPHWSVVEVGRANNGEDQTLSLSMWLSPSSSLRLKKTDGERARQAIMKSNLSRQALNGKEELNVPRSPTMEQEEGGGDWYVVINRQKASPTAQADPIDRMLQEGQSGSNDGSTSGHNDGNEFNSPTLGTLAQHQLDAAILGADFSVSGKSTPQILFDGSTGRLGVRAQYRAGEGSVSEKTLTSKGMCMFGKWTHVVVVISGANVRVYMDGALDSQMYLNGPVHMPNDSALYVGRTCPVSGGGGGDGGGGGGNNGGGDGGDGENLGFVGFLAHVIVHGRALDKLGKWHICVGGVCWWCVGMLLCVGVCVSLWCCCLFVCVRSLGPPLTTPLRVLSFLPSPWQAFKPWPVHHDRRCHGNKTNGARCPSTMLKWTNEKRKRGEENSCNK
jgi:hypothetical protein